MDLTHIGGTVMKLALNTFVYEVAKAPIDRTLESAKQFGFTCIEYAAYHAGDPTTMNPGQRRTVIQRFHDSGFHSSQLLVFQIQL